MGEKTEITWTDATWNPWQGCHRISSGCKNCYMYRDKERYGQNPNVVVRSKPQTFNAPLKWREPKLVFTCSWSDFFIRDADEWRQDAWDIIRQTPHLTYQILTKRPQRVSQSTLPPDWGDGWDNVWLGVTVESLFYLHRVAYLAEVPAKLRFVSYEPAIERVDFSGYLAAGWVDWIISGGESGTNHRPANIEWFRRVRDDCKKYNVPFFHKQHGGSKKIDGTWGGYLLDGTEWKQFPEERTNK